MLTQDMGCCFGQELRKAILDGYPEADTVASDLTSDYWCAFARLTMIALWSGCVVEVSGTLACRVGNYREAVCTPNGQPGSYLVDRQL